ncbi:hypothetical protein SAMN05660772_02848 [Pasteurella testudinis DSM 23072]|uniref:DUF4176 domain-containing protein n=1 Tax=Pasteurella testudinis DSM 23072 TaxID=1122938 RepID=A0A1W1V5L7_9PAST|nr:DUF4176 domain-containing protein [Pasteurella testudinis]SMB88662.1 hypothetical protein SAMN05660772_02848 [Pasteurella testudinis DSM 23072]SUB52159.1 Uncharacterized protein conserved in bacteria [Pasteurella testudinis]
MNNQLSFANRLLPIGSVIRLTGSLPEQKVLIINRVVAGKWKGENGYFEYAGCKHVVGAIENDYFYFNSENIEEVLFAGYVDDSEIELQKDYKNFLEETKLKKLNIV